MPLSLFFFYFPFFFSYKDEFDLADTESRKGILQRMYSHEMPNGKLLSLRTFELFFQKFHLDRKSSYCISSDKRLLNFYQMDNKSVLWKTNTNENYRGKFYIL